MADGDSYKVEAGGDITGPVAQGQHARSYYSVGGSPSDDSRDLQRRIEELQRMLAAHATALPDAERLRAVTEELGRQLGERRPNRVVVSSLLDALTQGAASVTTVLTAVNGLAQVVSRLI